MSNTAFSQIPYGVLVFKKKIKMKTKATFCKFKAFEHLFSLGIIINRTFLRYQVLEEKDKNDTVFTDLKRSPRFAITKQQDFNKSQCHINFHMLVGHSDAPAYINAVLCTQLEAIWNLHLGLIILVNH